MQFTRMQETTPFEAENSRPFPTGAIIKEAWQISTTYFWPLTMAIFVIQIPEKILESFANERQSWQISAWYEAIISGFVFVGVYRCIYRLKADGIAPTFSEIYNGGQNYYGRNFRMTWLINLYTILPVGLFAALAIPSASMLKDGSNAPLSYILLGVALILGLLLLAWWAIRIFMCRAVLSDDAPGATNAIDKTFSLSKGNVRMLTPVLMTQVGIYLAWLIVHMVTYFLIVGDFESDVSKALEVKISLLTSFPLAFVEAFAVAITALTYLHLKKASKPAEHPPAAAPATETPPA
jgi:hypothetical protein